MQVENGMAPESPEHCLREAEECDRLAGLSRTVATRQRLRALATLAAGPTGSQPASTT